MCNTASLKISGSPEAIALIKALIDTNSDIVRRRTQFHVEYQPGIFASSPIANGRVNSDDEYDYRSRWSFEEN